MEDMKDLINMGDELFLDDEESDIKLNFGAKEEMDDDDEDDEDLGNPSQEQIKSSMDVPKDQLHTFRLYEDSLNIGNTTNAYYYFDKENEDLIKCSNCTRSYKPSTRIDTLIRHLNKKHGIFSIPKNGQKGPENPFLSLNNVQTMDNNQHSEAQLEEAIVRWILQDSLSLSSLESPAFLNMLKLMCPNVQLPSRERLRELFTSMLKNNQMEENCMSIFDTQYQEMMQPILPVTNNLKERGKKRRSRARDGFQFVTFENES
ncbi:hypothetical protein K502DRAFT_364572 [Neoconidiobolus thromboides FSU 785]|nr:hypothetical protein K502DRAFT_364572 [Neoconidiobolus thromboides FSU 785]